MIRKLNLFKYLFNQNILKNSNINKNKQKSFIIYSDNIKLNWFLFRDIIVKAHYHYQIDPILFLTDSIGFADIDQKITELNPYNSTFNILSKIDLDFTKEKFVHQELKGIRYTIWWDELKQISEEKVNLLLFTNSKEELNQIIKTTYNDNREIVILYLTDDKKKINIDDNIIEKHEVWILKYNPKILKEWEDIELFKFINTKINIRKHKQLRRLRNKLLIIMNAYYKNSITPSYYNDEEKFEKVSVDIDKINSIYE